MKKAITVLLLPLLFSFSAVSQAQGLQDTEMDCAVSGAKEKQTRTDEHSAIEKEIMQLELATCRDIVAGNIDPMIDRIIAENGLLFADGGDIVVGKETQRTMFKEFLEAGFAIEFGPTDAFVSKSEDMAWAYGLYRLKTPDGAQDVGSYVSVWAKVNGAWKNVAEMRNSNGS